MSMLSFELVALFGVALLMCLITLISNTAFRRSPEFIASLFIFEGGIILGVLIYLLLSAYYPSLYLLKWICIGIWSICTSAIFVYREWKRIKRERSIN